MTNEPNRSLPSRREVLCAGAGLATAAQNPLRIDLPQIDRIEYLTRDADFGTVERGNPLPYTLPEPQLREIGMTRESWKLEVMGDAGTGVEAPMTIERGTTLDWRGLMKLAERSAVRYLKVITCNNLNAPLGMGLWEGVPLREAVWMARPVSGIRRVCYYGHHNEDPKQMFRSSLSLSRVLEDPPGDYPVLLAYKLNGEYLSGRRGGPVRMIVPEAYGFKSVKWLQRIVLSSLPGANDTYADEGNDIDSWMKTFARFLRVPEKARAGQPIEVTGVAQVGVSGLRSVQVWLNRKSDALPPNDVLLTKAPWRDAQLLGPPEKWGGGIPSGGLPPGVLGIEPATGRPKSWPMRYAIAHWTATLRDVPPGVYELRCRTIDSNGIAQPMPRPIGRGGLNHIEAATITIT
jgi:DMSO/TMAO reductase YedYZ molybdopterin-dependent catalytic subunit